MKAAVCLNRGLLQSSATAHRGSPAITPTGRAQATERAPGDPQRRRRHTRYLITPQHHCCAARRPPPLKRPPLRLRRQASLNKINNVAAVPPRQIRIVAPTISSPIASLIEHLSGGKRTPFPLTLDHGASTTPTLKHPRLEASQPPGQAEPTPVPVHLCQRRQEARSRNLPHPRLRSPSHGHYTRGWTPGTLPPAPPFFSGPPAVVS